MRSDNAYLSLLQWMHRKHGIPKVRSWEIFTTVWPVWWPESDDDMLRLIAKIWRPWRTDTHCVVCQIFVLTLLVLSLTVLHNAHALLRCDIAVSNFWYICPMDVCCLLLCYGLPYIIGQTIIFSFFLLLSSWCGLSANLECRSEMRCTRITENT